MTSPSKSRPRFVSPSVCLCLLLAAMLCRVTPALAAPMTYDEHQLIAVTLTSDADLETMLEISSDHWTDAVGIGEIPFRISPERLPLLKASGLVYRVLHPNIQDLIDAESEAMADAGRGWFDNYRSYSTISSYIDTLIGIQPDLVTRYSIGQSVQGRDIYGFTISAPGGPGDKPAILLNGCQHAREWISPMTVMFIADQLVQGYGTDPDVTSLVDGCDFHIIPVVNPDGYEYSRSSQRLWRKNRQYNADGSRGVDNNRNWGYEWGGEGSSSSPGSETYRGTSPFSEPENQAVRDFVLAHPEIVAHIDFHSHGQLILSPWGYEAAEPDEPNGSLFAALNVSLESAIEGVHGMGYHAGPSGETLYLASGVAPDWTYGDRGILAWTIELRDTGQYGFLLPPSQIIPTGEEAYAGVRALGAYVTEPFVYVLATAPPAHVPPRKRWPVYVELLSSSQQLDPATATIRWRTLGSDAFRATALEHQDGYRYAAPLPAVPCGAQIEYYLEASSYSGETRRLPADAPATVFNTTANLRDMLLDDFETDQGWLAGVPDDDATAGAWTRVDPIGTEFFGPHGLYPQPEDDHTAYGEVCYVTGQGEPGGDAHDADVDGGQTTLLSPRFDATDGQPTIRYWRWVYTSSDFFAVDISNDDGQSWLNLELIEGGDTDSHGGWRLFERPLAQVPLQPTTQMRLRFVAADEGGDSLVEAALDDVDVTSLSACQPPCYGDLDGDGVIGQGDLGVLLAAYGEDWGGDLDWDGDTDQADLGALLSLYGEVCD